MRFLAIDLGSSYIKSALINLKTKEILEKSKTAVAGKLYNKNELVHEVNMSLVLSTILTLINEYRQRCSSLKGIVLSTQMHGFVLSDAAYGEDVYVSWQDARCLCPMPGSEKSYLDHLKEMFSPEEMRSTGVYLKPALGMCNLYALLHARNFQTGKNAEIFTLGSYIISKLTGQNVCHISNAAPLGLVDIEAGAWREDLIEKAGFSGLRFPRITSGYEACGIYHVDDEDIPVFPDMGDVQCAVLGCGAGDGDAVINMATAGQVIMVRDTTDIGRADPSYYEVRPYFGRWYCHMVSRMPSGRNLDVLIDFLRDVGKRIYASSLSREEVWNRFLSDFSIGDAQGLQVDVSFYELPERLSDGAIHHIDRANLTLDNLFNAALNDIGSIYQHYIKMLGGESAPARNLIFSGGAIRNNPVLQDILSRTTGLPGRLSPMEDEVYAGLMQVSLWCAGLQETEKSIALEA